MSSVYIVHVQSESSENYYGAFLSKPTTEQVDKFQLECYKSEYGEEPEDECWQDLVGVRKIVRVEVN